MEFKRITLNEAAERMESWKKNTDIYIEKNLDKEYDSLREELLSGFEKVNTGHRYALDYQFGMLLYLTLSKYGFSLRNAADDGVWRCLSMCVIPDLIGRRWGKGAETRYYKQSGRIWLKTIWWYIHLSWQGNAKDTISVLATNTTDQILQLVDRSGSKGYFLETYRRIMYYYWVAKSIDSKVGERDFRRIMTLHTALCRNVEPDLCDDGCDGYVRMLFSKLDIALS